MTKIDLTKPVRTKSGEEVRILCTDRLSKYPVVGLVKYRSDPPMERISSWTEYGNTYEGVYNDDNDLENVPVKHVRWMNIFRTPGTEIYFAYGIFYLTRLLAEEVGKESMHYVTTVEIEWED